MRVLQVVVGGGSGFVGQAVCRLFRERGHKVVLISRRPSPGGLTWADIKQNGLPACDAVINLAGANVMAKRWTAEYKRQLFSSRIDTTQLLVGAIRRMPSPPAVFVAASATGYYAESKNETWTEDGPDSNDFIGLLVQAWEAASEPLIDPPTRRVLIRIGAVLGKTGGALKLMLPLFRLGLGGPVGPKNTPFSWIHEDDLAELFLFAVENPTVTGPVNGVAPNPTTTGEFAQTLGRLLHRPARLTVPAGLLKIVLGGRATILLKKTRVAPKKATGLGFRFQFPELQPALMNLIS